MNTILYILQKEFIQIFRNKTMLPIIFLMPVVQLVVLVFAANLELKNIDMKVVDNDKSTTSTELINKFKGSPYYNVKTSTSGINNAIDDLNNNKADIVLAIPVGFEKKLINQKQANLQTLVNAINNTSASLANLYTNFIISDYNKKILNKIVPVQNMNQQSINVESSFWFNPELNYKIYMLPGILVILITVIGLFLTALNLVREKEIGTIEQINVTPIRKHHLLIGKLIPFLIIAMFELAFGLTIGHLFFHMPIEGSLLTLFGFSLIYLLVALGIGLFISTISDNQQQVMFLSYFFLLTFILMSGIFTPVESMPKVAQYINHINPFFYYIKVIRMILLKGVTFADVSFEAICLSVYAVVIFTFALLRYKKTTN